MKTREGDLVDTGEAIFDVKGLVHPPNRTIAFIRYFLDEKGERKRNDRTYRKVYSLSKRYALLKRRFPLYLVYDAVFDETLCEVPNGEIKWHHKPVRKLQEMRSSNDMDALESKALRLAEVLKERASIPWDAIGVSGSILVGLHGAHSDVDPIVYGSKNCRKAYFALKDFSKGRDGQFKSYNEKDLKGLFDFRSKDSSADFESFVRTESRKVMQGKFLETDYFVRFVKDWNDVDEAYGDIQYRNDGVAKIKATIADDSEAIFTPCVYKVRSVQVLDGQRAEDIEEIVSFRGRFCEQARVGESVTAQGKLEHVNDRRHDREYFRLLLGNKPSDFMTLA
jgi:predicted nucleotidyltransferase